MAGKIQILFLFLVFGWVSGFSQNLNVLDSLIRQYEYETKNPESEKLLMKIDTLLYQFDKEFAINRWNYIIGWTEKNKNDFCNAYCHYLRGRKYNAEGEYFLAFNDYQKSIKLFKDAKNYMGLARASNALGILNQSLGNYSDSYKNYIESAKLFNKLNEVYREGQIYLNIGGMLTDLIDINSPNADTLNLTIGYLRKSIAILDSLNDENLIHTYINLGEVYNKTKNNDSAYYYLAKSYEISKLSENDNNRFQAIFHFSEFLLTQYGVEKAEPYLIEIIGITADINNLNGLRIEDREGLSHLLSDYYSKKGDYKLAFQHLTEANRNRTQSKTEQSKLQMSRSRFAELQQKSERDQRRATMMIVITILGAAISALLFFAFYKSYRAKQKANELLTELDELKSRFYSNITHEIRTPLTLILSPLEQMLSSEIMKVPDRKQVKMMRKNAKIILNMVNQMLDLSKIEAKNVKLDLVEDDLNKFLRTHFASFTSVAEQKQINYQYSLLKEKNLQIFDAEKLEKIIHNLVSNAIKYTKKQGEIVCAANYPKENQLSIEISDTGIGIPKTEISHIFNRYHRVKNIENINIVGTGIGLSLTSELVELMHGSIKVESEPGKGSKFTVLLPLGTNHLSIDEYELIHKNNHTKPNKIEEVEELTDSTGDEESDGFENHDENLPLILIVEDNKDVCEYIVENLKTTARLKIAHNGMAGLKKAIDTIPDLIITDVMMPKMDGITMCQNLKSDEKTSHIPVIILSGKSDTEDRIVGIETGADAFLSKPFNINELKHLAHNLIEQRRKLRERFTRNLKLEPKEIAITSADEKFITRAMEIIEKNIGNSEFEVSQFQDEMFMSRMQLFRKIKALTNQTPGDFIRTIRLKRAADLIRQNFGNIAQITYEVGFNNPSYFAKCFKELYGVLPSDFQRNNS